MVFYFSFISTKSFIIAPREVGGSEDPLTHGDASRRLSPLFREQIPECREHSCVLQTLDGQVVHQVEARVPQVETQVTRAAEHRHELVHFRLLVLFEGQQQTVVDRVLGAVLGAQLVQLPDRRNLAARLQGVVPDTLQVPYQLIHAVAPPPVVDGGSVLSGECVDHRLEFLARCVAELVGVPALSLVLTNQLPRFDHGEEGVGFAHLGHDCSVSP